MIYLSLHYANDNPPPIKYIDDILDDCDECGHDCFEGQGKRFVCTYCRHVKVFR